MYWLFNLYGRQKKNSTNAIAAILIIIIISLIFQVKLESKERAKRELLSLQGTGRKRKN